MTYNKQIIKKTKIFIIRINKLFNKYNKITKIKIVYKFKTKFSIN